jgi:hypothetical protein
MNKAKRNYPTRIHELLELEPYEQFDIRGYDETFYLSQGGTVHEVKENTLNEPVAQLMLSILIQDPFLILRKPNLIIKDKGELKILEGLYLKGYRYMVKDSHGCLFAYKEEPWKNDKEWKSATGVDWVLVLIELFWGVFNMCKFSDSKPLEIAEVLKANGVEI